MISLCVGSASEPSYPPLRGSADRSAQRMVAPSEARQRAIARPFPEEAPVTMATWPDSLPGCPSISVWKRNQKRGVKSGPHTTSHRRLSVLRTGFTIFLAYGNTSGPSFSMTPEIGHVPSNELLENLKAKLPETWYIIAVRVSALSDALTNNSRREWITRQRRLPHVAKVNIGYLPYISMPFPPWAPRRPTERHRQSTSKTIPYPVVVSSGALKRP
jgi:hypothetical protein